MNSYQRWIDKYRPTRINEIIGHDDSIKNLKKFLQTYDEDDPNLIIDGPNGIGKSLIIDLLLKELKFTKIIPNLNNISKEQGKSKKLDGVKEYYYSLFNRRDITNLNINNKEKIAVIIDDIETITGKNEKMGIKNFHKINMKHKLMPFIIVSSNKHNKIINSLKKTSKTIYFNKLSNACLTKLIMTIAANEKLHLVQSSSGNNMEDLYNDIIWHSQGDIRCLINTLEQLKAVFGENRITINMFSEFCETSTKKDIDMSIYDATKSLMSMYQGISKSNELYEIEKVIVPLMLHQNYISHIKTQLPYISAEEKITLINTISKCLSNGDLIEGFIYSNQTWDLQNIHSFYTCAAISFLLNDFSNKLNRPEKYLFTKDMNKASIQKINTKNIFKTQKNYYMKNITITDFIYINKIVRHLLDEKKYEEIAQLLGPYKLNIEQIDSLLKIDKLKISKNNLTAKQKRKIMQYLPE